METGGKREDSERQLSFSVSFVPSCSGFSSFQLPYNPKGAPMKRRGFSLVELVVLLAMAGVLLGLVIPAVRSAQVAGVKKETIDNLKQLALACHNCNDAFKRLPPAFDQFGDMKFPASIYIHLLPYLEQANVYKIYRMEKGKGMDELVFRVYQTGDDPSTGKKEGIVNFAANLRVFTTKGNQTKYDKNMPALAAVEPGQPSIPRTFRDGTSNTILFATKYGHCGQGGSRYAAAPNTAFAPFFGQNAAKVKAHPSDKTATFQLRPGKGDCCTSPLMAQSFTKAGIQAALADGSVRTVSANLSPQTWNAALQPNDGQVLGRDWDN
jgi:hypothetical protein